MERSLEALLSWWEISGVDIPEIPKKVMTGNTTPQDQHTGLKAETHKGSKSNPDLGEQPPVLNTIHQQIKKITTLDALYETIANFDAGQISDHARQTVFARGNPQADIMVIGEAPNKDDDVVGKPFMGKSGTLLDKVFESIGLSHNQLYMTYIINWYPPAGRNPTAREIETCKPFIKKHMELMKPKIIIMVGGIAFSTLSGDSGIMKKRGQWTTIKINEHYVPAMPIYTPEFLLSQPELKKQSWLDMLSLRTKMTELSISI